MNRLKMLKIPRHTKDSTMIEILYYAFIFPLQSVLGFALESLFNAIKSYGLSIIILSILVNVFLLKLSKIAESKAHKTNVLKASCDSKIAEFKRVFKGAELQSYIRTLYRQRHYHPIFALSGLGGLALQVPFFVAVLCLLQDFEGIKGESFLWISDLSAPDSVGGIHILPILMTIISLVNVWIVAKEKGARIQGAMIALIFLVLLYKMPSALVLYWTSNMAFSLCNSLLGMQFRRFGKFRAFADFKSSLTPKICQKLRKPHRNTFDCDSLHESKNKNESSLREFASANSWQSKDSPSLAEGVRGWVNSFFILRKTLKIAVISLTAILAIGLCATFSLMLYAKDNVQTSPITLESNNNAKIHYIKYDFLLRSKTISRIYIISVAWDKAIDSSDISNIKQSGGRYVSFNGSLDLEKGTNLGQISYIMNFTPLMQNLFRYYFAILGAVLGIYLLICVIWRFQAYRESNAQTYHKITNYAILCIAFLICVFTPYQLYNTDITQFDSAQTYSTLSALLWAFMLCSFIAIYALSFIPKRFSNFVAFILSVILFSGIVYSFILVGDYGAMDHFLLQKAPESSAIQIFEFIIVLTLGIALVAFTLTKLMRVWQIVLLTLFIVSGVNAFQIIDKRMDSAKVAQETQNNDKSKPPYENELFSYSKTQKNIVVIVLDMFSGSHTPYILEQFPHFKEQLDGFVLFPNTISTTNSTIHSIATLIGGEYYATYNMNKRKENLTKQIDSAFIGTANAFASADFSVSLMAFTGSKIDNINAQTNSQIFTFDAESEVFLDYYIHSVGLAEKVATIKKRTQNIILGELLTCGIFIFAPKILRPKIYNNGKWLFKVEQKILDIFSTIKSASSFYATTHILNTNVIKPTFKYFHSMMTHLPYGMYFHNNKCKFFSDKTAWEDYPHKATMYYPNKGRKEGFYQHFDTESCALKYLADYIELLKNAGIYDNTQIFVVSDHSGNDNINIPILDKDDSRPDSLLLFKDFGAKGSLKIDNRLMANYDIVSIFCANLKNGCPNVPKNILQNYPLNREIIHTIPTTFILERHQENEWLITKAYKVRKDIYNAENWVDISDSKYGIVNVKK